MNGGVNFKEGRKMSNTGKKIQSRVESASLVRITVRQHYESGIHLPINKWMNRFEGVTPRNV